MNLTDLIKKSSQYRIFISRMFIPVLICFLLFTTYSWPRNSFFDIAIGVIGFILIVICAFGRLWAALYIYGKKNIQLITEGPYSMVRNPLYFFSFLGALGIGLLSKNIIVFALILLFFLAYYPFVVLAEEDALKNIHKEKYLLYMKSTPRFFPKFSLIKEPKQLLVNTIKLRKAFGDIMWFFWFYVFIKLVDTLHVLEILPVLWEIPWIHKKKSCK